VKNGGFLVRKWSYTTFNIYTENVRKERENSNNQVDD